MQFKQNFLETFKRLSVAEHKFMEVAIKRKEINFPLAKLLLPRKGKGLPI